RRRKDALPPPTWAAAPSLLEHPAIVTRARRSDDDCAWKDWRALEAPLTVYDIHVARLTRHHVRRAGGNLQTGNRWNAGSARGEVKVDLSASGNRELDDRAGIG